MTSSRMWTVNLRTGMSVLAILAPPIVTPPLTLKVMSLPAKFWTVSPSVISPAKALPEMTWLRRTVFTVSAFGGDGRLPMNVWRAASVGAKRVICELPLRASTSPAFSMRDTSVLSPWFLRPSWRLRPPRAGLPPAVFLLRVSKDHKIRSKILSNLFVWMLIKRCCFAQVEGQDPVGESYSQFV